MKENSTWFGIIVENPVLRVTLYYNYYNIIYITYIIYITIVKGMLNDFTLDMTY